jgi:hypothetical protein
MQISLPFHSLGDGGSALSRDGIRRRNGFPENQSRLFIQSCSLRPPNSSYRNFKVASSLRSPSAKANLFLAFGERKLLSCGFQPPNSTYRYFKVLNIHHSIFKLHLLRIAKFALGVRQFIAAFNDGIYSVPSRCREINFTKQGGNKLPHSMERCHARKSKIHSNMFDPHSKLEVRC